MFPILHLKSKELLNFTLRYTGLNYEGLVITLKETLLTLNDGTSFYNKEADEIIYSFEFRWLSIDDKTKIIVFMRSALKSRFLGSLLLFVLICLMVTQL